MGGHNKGLLFGGSDPRRASMERARGSAGKAAVVIPDMFEPVQQGLGMLDSGACKGRPARMTGKIAKSHEVDAGANFQSV